MTKNNTHDVNDYDFIALTKSTSDKRMYQRLMILAQTEAYEPVSRPRTMFMSNQHDYSPGGEKSNLEKLTSKSRRRPLTHSIRQPWKAIATFENMSSNGAI